MYCGEIIGRELQNQDISDEYLREHVKVCQKHPLSAALAKVKRLKALVESAYYEALERGEENAAHALLNGRDWQDCVCAEIDPSDRPCMACAAKHEASWNGSNAKKALEGETK